MEKLIAILENYVESDCLNANSSFVKDLGMSSFDIVCFVTEINKEFLTDVTPQDFVKYKTVGELYAFLKQE